MLLAVLLLAVGLTLTNIVLVGALQRYQIDRLDRQLQTVGEFLARRDPPGLNSDTTSRTVLPRVGLIGDVYIAYLNADGTTDRLLAQSGDATLPVLNLDSTAVAAYSGKPFDMPGPDGTSTWRVLTQPRSSAAAAGSSVVVAASLDEVNATVNRIALVCVLSEAVLLILLAAAGWFAIGAGLAPLRQIERTAAAIAGGDLSQRVPQLANPWTEVGRLAAALNGMLLEIERAFAAQAESEARMRRFLADVSHELRTPLFGIKGFTELYRMGGLPERPDVDRTMLRIESEAERLVQLAEDLLYLAQLEGRDSRAPQYAQVDLHILAADALYDLHALDASRPLRLTGPDGGSPCSALVMGDEAELRRVVTNLVSNVVAHTPPGSPVRIGVGTIGDTAIFEIEDRGPGLTPEQAGRVFERLYRVEHSRNRASGSGAGLGLAIAQSLASAHRGRLVVRSIPCQGATFRLTLPAGGE
ncbi:MAG: HAMP domain-containing histidine kinase [Chloroflexi bacterium]|nr:HAMP domain-containing histidine kinase [Chloroflexota bacterium]